MLFSFVDIGECGENIDNCSADASCAVMTQGVTCICNSGYSGDGETCTSKGIKHCLQLT